MKALASTALATFGFAAFVESVPGKQNFYDATPDLKNMSQAGSTGLFQAGPIGAFQAGTHGPSFLGFGLSFAGSVINAAETALAESKDAGASAISSFRNNDRDPTYLKYGIAGGINVLRSVTNSVGQESATAEIKKLQERANQKIQRAVQSSQSGCTSEKIMRRQEWGTLSKESRIAYIQAVKCLQQKSPRTPKADAPGARSRFDDFVVHHIKRTPFIHFNGIFLAFHRHFTWLYEKALREECGYQGAQPYWDWTLSWKDLSKSTVFDGSPTSLGSNGRSIPHGVRVGAAFGLPLAVPPGSGGGCVHSGPFSESEYNVTLGPVGFFPRGPLNGLGSNPRCLKRDFSLLFGSFTKPTDILNLLTQCTDVDCFDKHLETPPGAHLGGHGGIGGDPDFDVYASPSDPAFFLHHASVDRMWTIWQNLADGREDQTYGTQTAFNVPPSDKVTLDTSIPYGVLGNDKKVGKIASTVEDEYCYMYV